MGRWVTGWVGGWVTRNADDDTEAGDEADDADDVDENAVAADADAEEDDDENELLAVVCDTGLYGKCEIVF